jgi:K(+)-stimulated pyrophosphate-energized sodium pump
VGDPFKDTSGPSMNILIKLMSIVSLVIAPTLAEVHREPVPEVKHQPKQLLIGDKKVASNVQMSLHLKDNNDVTFSVKR